MSANAKAPFAGWQIDSKCQQAASNIIITCATAIMHVRHMPWLGMSTTAVVTLSKCYATMCLAENMRDWKASEQGSPLEHVFQLVLFSAPTLSIAKHAAALHCLGRLLSQNVNISAALSSRCGNLLVLLAPSGRKHGKSRARPDHCHRPVELWRLSDFCASSGRSNSVPMADVLSNNHTPATPPRFRHR